MSDTPGFFLRDQIGSLAEEREAFSLTPATTGEVLGAAAGQAFAENPASRLGRFVNRNLMAPGAETTLTPEEANTRFGVAGRLTFDSPTSEAVARDLNEHHRANQARADVLARRNPEQFGQGGVALFGAGLAAAIIDPLNVASAFIPFLPEARLAAMAVNAGRAARVAMGVGRGVVEGALGAAVLEPVNYGLARLDHDDYSMGDVLTNIAFGAALGGVLHGAAAALRPIRGTLPAEAHEAALREAMVATTEGRPVQAAAVADMQAASSARAELTRFADAQMRLSNEADAALTRAIAPEQAAASTASRLAQLRDEVLSITRESQDARARYMAQGLDPDTIGRLQAVEQDLAGTIPAARRASLERERQMILEGVDHQQAALDEARTEAEMAGLGKALGRAKSKLALAEAAAAKAEARTTAANRTLEIESARVASREAMLPWLAERTIRRLAGRLGVQLAEGEASDLASRALREPKGIEAAVADLMARKGGPPIADTPLPAPNGTLAGALERLATAEHAATADVMASKQAVPNAPEIAERRAAAMSVENAPKVEGKAADDLAEIEKQVQELEAGFKALEPPKVEGQPAAPTPELDRINEQAKLDEGTAKAFEAAAACLIRSA